MTPDMSAIERMLKTDSSKKGRDAAPTKPKASGFGSGGVTWAEKDDNESLEPPAGMPGQYKRPDPGSAEEMQVMQAAWADPEFRKSFYDQFGDKLEAAGIACDGTFPGMDQLNGIPGRPGQDPDGPRGLTITPEPGFVIKTKTLETNEKVFINFCKSPKVRSFGREPDPNDASVERVRIPLSLGPARNDLDKSGEPCIVYDVVFNTEVMDQALHAKEFKDFLVGLGMGWVMEKGGGGLDIKNYTEAKLRGNYKGKFPAMQVVRAEALIEEMEPVDEGGNYDGAPHHAWDASLNPSSFSATRAAAENSNYADSFRGAEGFHKEGRLPGYAKVEEVRKGVEAPEFRRYVDVEGGHQWAYQEGKDYQGEIQAFVVKVELPRMESANDADLDVAEDSLSLEVEGKYELDIDLPFKVDDNAADAAWDRHKRILTLTLPLKSWTARAYAKARAATAAEYGAVEEAEPVKAEAAQKDAEVDAAPTEVAKKPTKEDPAAKPAAETKKKKEESEFEMQLKKKLEKQRQESEIAALKEPARPILGSRQEQQEKENMKKGASVSNRLPFRCERCNWGSAATAVRKCRRCMWCEPGSKEEAEAWAQAQEHQKFRSSRKQDEVGAVEEDGGIEEENSVRAFQFTCRTAYELDDDSPGWLEAVREKHYGGQKTEGHKEFKGVDITGMGVAAIENTPVSAEDARKKEERDRVMPLNIKGLPTIEPLD